MADEEKKNANLEDKTKSESLGSSDQIIKPLIYVSNYGLTSFFGKWGNPFGAIYYAAGDLVSKIPFVKKSSEFTQLYNATKGVGFIWFAANAAWNIYQASGGDPESIPYAIADASMAYQTGKDFFKKNEDREKKFYDDIINSGAEAVELFNNIPSAVQEVREKARAKFGKSKESESGPSEAQESSGSA